MWGMQGMRGMFTRISWNLLEDSGDAIILTLREYSRRFREIFKRTPGNV